MVWFCISWNLFWREASTKFWIKLKLGIYDMLNKEKNITVAFLLLFLLFLVMDHVYSKNNSIQIENQEHTQHEEGASPCGM